ncbi:MAG: type II toxin-antitoxin system Phd/YefM family antitoxin [Verrucomicrobiales bacterium]
MKTVSMLELRSRGRDIVRRLEKGERLALTYRGKKVATLVPESPPANRVIPADDPIRRLHEIAEPMGSMTNEEIDQLLYGEP